MGVYQRMIKTVPINGETVFSVVSRLFLRFISPLVGVPFKEAVSVRTYYPTPLVTSHHSEPSLYLLSTPFVLRASLLLGLVEAVAVVGLPILAWVTYTFDLFLS